MINISDYKPNIKYLTKDILRANNFKYIDGCYSYRFPVNKYKNRITLWCDIYIDIDENYFSYSVIDSNFKIYHPFYNREYGKNKVVTQIENIIKLQLGILVNKLLIIGGNT